MKSAQCGSPRPDTPVGAADRADRLGNRGQVSSSATKAGLVGGAASISQQAMFHGARARVVHPGFTDTPMVRALGAHDKAPPTWPVRGACQWAREDLNLGPHPYQGCALTN